MRSPVAFVMTYWGRQLAHPAGFSGRMVGRMLNRGNAPTIAAAIEASAVGPGDVTADLGFGGGIGLRILLSKTAPDGVVHGVELSRTLLAAAGQRLRAEARTGRLQLHEGQLERLPLQDASVDAAITLNTFYFVADLAVVCAELARILRPGGRVVLGLGHPDAMARLPFTANNFQIRPIPEVRNALTGAGLQVVEDRRVGNGADAYHLLVATRPTQAHTSGSGMPAV